jgi:methionyl-tRNA formyltransferase
MHVVFFGTSAFAVPSVQALAAAGHRIIRCVTQPDRPQGRGLVTRPSPVKTAAQALGLPIEEPDDLHAAAESLRALNPELGVAIAYGRILPVRLLAVPRHGMLGVHPSLLPKYRGANPIARAILDGHTSTGVTIFRLNARMDAGEIAAQQRVDIGADETTEQLSDRLARLGAALLTDVVARMERGGVAWQPQHDTEATIAAKFAKDDGRVDWSQPAERLRCLIRAVTPWPGAMTTWRGQPLKLLASRTLTDAPAGGAPGQILTASSDGLAVATGRGQLLVTELQLAGSRRMVAAEFLRGHAVQPGERLGGSAA